VLGSNVIDEKVSSPTVLAVVRSVESSGVSPGAPIWGVSGAALTDTTPITIANVTRMADEDSLLMLRIFFPIRFSWYLRIYRAGIL
jgi:hypothetical protein